MPLIGSAGWPANQPSTCVLYPRCVRMFQIAFTLREVLVTGRTPPVCGSGSMNPENAVLIRPLAGGNGIPKHGRKNRPQRGQIPDHSMINKIVERRHQALIEKGLMIFQSAASQPISSTFLMRRLNRSARSPLLRGQNSLLQARPGTGFVEGRMAACNLLHRLSSEPVRAKFAEFF
jgi:hypothetical protein